MSNECYGAHGQSASRHFPANGPRDIWQKFDACWLAHGRSPALIGVRHGNAYMRVERNLSALPTTDTEDRLMAAAAKIGEIRIPKNGKRIPAATGTPEAL